MLDSIYIGMSGLVGYSKGLRVISNNLTNVNTAGFKGSQLQFVDLFYQENSADRGSSDSTQLGTGINALATAVNFKQGELQQTGNNMDLAVNGKGFFVVKKDGETRYTRAGQFQFDQEGFLVSRVDSSRVQSINSEGRLADISLDGLRFYAAKQTANITFDGVLTTDVATTTVNNVKVLDEVGGEHLLTLVFTKTATVGTWTVDVKDGATAVGSGTIKFSGAAPVPSDSKISLTYSPAGVGSIPLVFDFSTNTSSFSVGVTSTLKMTQQDGYVAGSMTDVSFDAEGYTVVSYSNGKTNKGPRLALASFESDLDLKPAGGNMFELAIGKNADLGYAKTSSFGSISGGVIEGSNVDMAEEFSQLIVMQRGYQASSHVVSTANDMIQELFDMKGHR